VASTLGTCAQRGCDAPAVATVGVQTRNGERRFGLCRAHHEDATTLCAVDGCRMLAEYAVVLGEHAVNGSERVEGVRLCAEHWQQYHASVPMTFRH
jgi:hypothetical protein